MDIGFDENRSKSILKNKLGIEPNEINFKSFWHIAKLTNEKKTPHNIDPEIFLSFYKLSEQGSFLSDLYKDFLVSTYKNTPLYDPNDLIMFFFCLKYMGIRGLVFERNFKTQPLNLDKINADNQNDIKLVKDLILTFRYLVLPNSVNSTLLDLNNKTPSNIQLKNAIIKWQEHFASQEIKKIDQKIDSKKDGQITELEKFILYSHLKAQNLVTWASLKKMMEGKSWSQ